MTRGYLSATGSVRAGVPESHRRRYDDLRVSRGSRSTDTFWCLFATSFFGHSKLSCHAALVKRSPLAWCMDYRCVECRFTGKESPEFRAYALYIRPL